MAAAFLYKYGTPRFWLRKKVLALGDFVFPQGSPQVMADRAVQSAKKRSRWIALAKHAVRVCKDLLGQREIPPKITRRHFVSSFDRMVTA
jgi:hypothetical protein